MFSWNLTGLGADTEINIAVPTLVLPSTHWVWSCFVHLHLPSVSHHRSNVPSDPTFQWATFQVYVVWLTAIVRAVLNVCVTLGWRNEAKWAAARQGSKVGAVQNCSVCPPSLHPFFPLAGFLPFFQQGALQQCSLSLDANPDSFWVCFVSRWWWCFCLLACRVFCLFFCLLFYLFVCLWCIAFREIVPLDDITQK